MRVGITATRKGLRALQHAKLAKVLLEIRDNRVRLANTTELDRPWLLHGDCVGGDHAAHKLALKLKYRIQVHPPSNPKLRAFAKDYDVILDEQDYLVRNAAIVREANIMIGLPETPDDRLRSGTWSTIRLTKRNEKALIVILPDGRCLKYNGARRFTGVLENDD